MKTYLIRFNSESGDQFTVGLFTGDEWPTKRQLDRIAREDLPEQIEDGVLWGRMEVEEIEEGARPLPVEDMDAEPLDHP